MGVEPRPTDYADIITGIEAEFLLRGILKRQYRRDPRQPPDEFGHRPFLLIQGRPQFRWQTNAIAPHIRDLIEPQQFERLRELQPHQVWPELKNILTEQALLILWQRVRALSPPLVPNPPTQITKKHFREVAICKLKRPPKQQEN